jgi:hypothetical protein
MSSIYLGTIFRVEKITGHLLRMSLIATTWIEINMGELRIVLGEGAILG